LTRGITSVTISSIERRASGIDPVHAGIDDFAEIARLLAQLQQLVGDLVDRTA
jgi:hypothetical protein